MRLLGLIFLGSGLGGVLRYALGTWLQKTQSGTFPIGTLAVNVVGCLLMGFLTAALSGRLMIRDEFRVALLVGVLGGFTTFSAFGMETVALLYQGRGLAAGVNIVLSVVLGLAAIWIGFRAGEGLAI